MGEWIPHNLGELIEVQNGYAFKSKDFDDFNGIPVIKIKNVASGELRMDDIKYYPFSIERLEEFVISKNDILIALTGSHVHQPSSIVGKVAIYTKDDISLLNQRVGKIYSLDKKVTNEDYIYWFFKQWEVTLELALNAGGSANQANISGKLIKTLELELPPLPEQKAIASVLSSLDDKIDLLHRQNKTLEAMAETFFRQWFVPARAGEPHAGGEEADEDWDDGCLGDVIELFDHLRIPLSKMERDKKKNGQLYPYYGAAKVMDYINDYIFDGDYILLGEDGTVRTDKGYPVLQYATGKFWVNNHTHVIKAKPPYNNFFLWNYLSKKNIDEIVTGAVQPKINQGNLKALDFPKFPEDLVIEFNEQTESFFKKINHNQTQIHTLEKLRDTLLPKLINGEVRVAV
jgi:type I restriction enzyme, S subunit